MELIGQSDLDLFGMQGPTPLLCCEAHGWQGENINSPPPRYLPSIHTYLDMTTSLLASQQKPNFRRPEKRASQGSWHQESLIEIGGRHTEAKETCKLQPDFTRMDREQMKMAIMEQEQTFRQQVHELHRVYHVQEQLMREMQTAMLNQAHAEKKKPQLNLLAAGENAADHQQLYSAPNSSTPAAVEDCNLELTLATGSTSGSGSSSRSHKGKQAIKSSNSDSGTAVSSTSTDSDLAQFKEFDVTPARFQSESMRHGDEMNQSPWLHQCVSLRMA